MTMWEKQISTKAIGIQKENLGLNNHALFFSKITSNNNSKKISNTSRYVAFFFPNWDLMKSLKNAVTVALISFSNFKSPC